MSRRPTSRWLAARWGLLLAALLVALLALPAAASADGDPGSDVLLGQNLYAPAATGLSAKQQLALGNVLAATAKAGAPIRVAIVPTKSALGSVTALWREPSRYAPYLGTELAGNYSGRLLIVMPNGFGVEWFSKGTPGAEAMATALAHVKLRGATGAAVTTTVTGAVNALETAGGVSAAKLKSLTSSSSAASTTAGNSFGAKTANEPTTAAATKTKHKLPSGLFAVILLALLGIYVAYRSGRLKNVHLRRPRLRERSSREPGRGGLFGLGISPVALLPAGILVVVIVVLLVQGGGSTKTSPQLQLAAENPSLDTGTAVDKAAPNFTLTDEQGKSITLSQYKGKVVILSFIDAECQTICPLTSSALLDAKRDLGAAGKDVQLLAVNANWRSTQIEDVLNYTQLHGMEGEWHFLTSTRADPAKQLEQVANDYGVNELKLLKALHESTSDIDHPAATFLIDRKGNIRRVYETQTAYAAIPQFGQVLAQDASALLPHHPAVRSDLSYTHVIGITPTETTTLPKVGGGKLSLSPGKPHLYVFFDTWDTQTVGLAKDMLALNRYERLAVKDGLPRIAAIDEGSVEPNSKALPKFLHGLPGTLDYPVAIDRTGQVADGYEVEGAPWFVAIRKSGQLSSYQEVYTSQWPRLKTLVSEAKTAIAKVSTGVQTSKKVARDLSDSPPRLAALHKQSSKLLSGGEAALQKRISSLRGYPVVVNIWNSICEPCQKEVKFFQHASAQYGQNVAFLGGDNEDQAGIASEFLREHPVSYPSYQTNNVSIENLLVGGLPGTPTTLFFNAAGKMKIKVGAYKSQSALDADIDTYALGSGN